MLYASPILSGYSLGQDHEQVWSTKAHPSHLLTQARVAIRATHYQGQEDEKKSSFCPIAFPVPSDAYVSCNQSSTCLVILLAHHEIVACRTRRKVGSVSWMLYSKFHNTRSIQIELPIKRHLMLTEPKRGILPPRIDPQRPSIHPKLQPRKAPLSVTRQSSVSPDPSAL